MIEFISLDQLRFDPQNPRLPSSIKGDDNEAVIAYLLREESLIELMGSIGQQGYFAGEPLLVCQNPADKNIYWVVEGNRRFASVMLLSHPELAAAANKLAVQAAASEAIFKPSTLPAVIYSSRDEILGYLSYRHITGIKAWNPLQKAKYLSQLRKEVIEMPIDKQFRSLAKSIGTRSDYVARLLTGYSIYTEIASDSFYGIRNLNEETLSFSILTTALTYSNIRQYLGLESNADPEVEDLVKPRLKELTQWMFEPNTENRTRLGESRNLKYLSEVVASPKALAAFKAGLPLVDAKDLTQEPAELFRSTISQARQTLTTARGTLHLVDVPTAGDDEVLREIQALARDMRAVVSDKLREAEDAI